METKNSLSIFFLLLAGLQCISSVTGHSSFWSYQTNSIDDGNNVVTNIASKHYDSRNTHGSKMDHRIIIEPSGKRLTNNQAINKQQMSSNKIGVGLEDDFFGQSVFMQPFNGVFRPRGFLTSARAVESPALVADSSERSGTSVAGELAKLLNIKQGHYADLYDQIDQQNQPTTGTTRRPVDAVEDAVRAAVVRLYREQNRRRKDHHS